MLQNNQQEIAILYFAMGDELSFLNNFYHSAEQFLLPNHSKQYFVISDKELKSNQNNVTCIQVENIELQQPHKCFSLYFAMRETLSQFKYCYAFSADTQFISPITADVFLPHETQPFVLYSEYPDIDHVSVNEFPYERKEEANSYIPYNLGSYFFSTVLFGGATDKFLSACQCINAALEDDINNHLFSEKIVEKHLNRYFLYKNNAKVLPAHFIRESNEPWKINAKIATQSGIELLNQIPSDVMDTVNNLDKIFEYQSYESFFDLQKKVAGSWRKLLKAYLCNQLEKFSLAAKKEELIGKKIIWQYWGQGIHSDLPELTKVCFSSVDKNKGDYLVIRVDDNSLSDYVDLPDFVWQKKDLFGAALFSDIVRLCLLYTYGGVWIDATIILSSPLPEELLKQDFLLFRRDPNNFNKAYWEGINRDYFCWDKEHNVNSLNSFIISNLGNIITGTLLQLMLNFWKTQDKVDCYYIFQILFEQVMRYYLSDNDFILLDDTVPHELIMKLWSEYNKQEIDELFSRCQVHKLTSHADLSECGKNSVWEYLKREYL